MDILIDYLRINNILLIANGLVREGTIYSADKGRAFSGEGRTVKTGSSKRTWSFRAGPYAPEEALFLAALIDGWGDKWSFNDSDWGTSYSSKGVPYVTNTAPDSISGKFAHLGAEYLGVSLNDSIAFPFIEPGLVYSVALWVKLVDAWEHYIINNVFQTYYNGQRDDTKDTSWATFSEDGDFPGIIISQAANRIDDLVVIPEQIYPAAALAWYQNSAPASPLPHLHISGEIGGGIDQLPVLGKVERIDEVDGSTWFLQVLLEEV